jgi:ribosomal protein L10
MKKENKHKFVEEYKNKISSASIVILTSFKGIDAISFNKLRKNLYSHNVEYKVVKNRIFKRIIEDMKYDSNIFNYLRGETGIVIGYDEPTVTAKLITEFMKENEKLKIKCGLIQNKVVSSEYIDALAKLPPRNVLYSQLVYTMKFPIYHFALTLSQIMRKLIIVLELIKKQKEGGK